MASSAAQIVVSLRNNASGEVRKLASDFRGYIQTLRDAGVSQELAERRALSLAQAQAKLLVSSGQAAQGERTLIAALSQVDAESAAAARTATQLVNVQSKTASAAQQFGEASKSSLLSVLGPAALVGTAIAAVKGTVDSFKDAFVFKAQLDQTNASIALQLRGVRDSGQAFAEAQRFAETYKLTQEETSQAIQASIPILRQSKASLTEVESTLLRLQAKKPEKSIADAARALDELKSGQILSIVDQFNVSRDAANQMKDEIANGADAVRVLSTYLTDAGIGMDALSVRTKGVAGSLNDLKKTEEDLKLAEAGFAQGPGMAILQERIILTRGLTNLLSGQFKTTEDSQRAFEGYVATLRAATTFNFGPLIQSRQADAQAAAQQAAIAQISTNTLNLQSPAMIAAGQASEYQSGAMIQAAQSNIQAADAALAQLTAIQRVTPAIQEFNIGLQKNAADAQIGAAQSTILKERQDEIARTARLAALGMLGEGDQALLLAQKLGVARDEALLLIAAQNGIARGQAQADFRAEERGGLTDSQLRARSAADKLHQQFITDEARKAKEQHAAELQLQLTRAKTSTQRIALLQKELAGTSDLVERTKLLTQIAQEKNSADRKSVVASNKGLSANDRADLALVDDLDAKHAALLAKLQQANLTELQRKQILNDIQEVEKKISAEKDKQVQSALDARIAAVEDRKQRRQEDRELSQAQRVLASNASQAFKDAARDQLELIPLQQQRRQLALQQQLREAGPLAGVLPASGVPALPSLPGRSAAAPLPALPSLPAAAGAGALPQFDISVFLDGKQIAAEVVVKLRGGLDQTRAAGTGRP